MDKPPFEWHGQKFTAYAATQQQRYYEREMRRCKRQIIAHSGDKDGSEYQRYSEKLNKLYKLYSEFSKKAGLPEQLKRAWVLGFGRKEAAHVRAQGRKKKNV